MDARVKPAHDECLVARTIDTAVILRRSPQSGEPRRMATDAGGAGRSFETPRRRAALSDCLFSQAVFGCHGVLSRRIALRIVSSFLATAMIAASFGLPAATSLSRNSLSSGL